jgi:simple sugar transport system permease protein
MSDDPPAQPPQPPAGRGTDETGPGTEAGPAAGTTDRRSPVPAAPATGGAATGGAEAAAGQRPPFGRMLIDAIVEGNSVVVTVLAIVAAIVVGGLLIAFTDPVVLSAWGRFFSDPGNAIAQAWDTAFSAYAAMFEGSIVNPHTVAAIFQQKSLGVAFSDGAISAVLNPISETLVNATPLIFAGLSVALAFRAGLFNIGAESQFIGGAIIATWLGFGVSLPPVIHVVVCVLGAFVGGAVLGWLVGFLKAATGAHEVIVTIMLNYVMADFLAWILGTSVMQRPGRSDLISPLIAGDAHLPQLLGSHLRVNASFLLALACAVGVWWLLNRSTIGFEFRSVGANPNAARSAGMSVPRTWIMVMLIAGGLAGLAASAVVQGTDFTLTFQSYGTYGIDAITVALLGRARPLGVVLAALLFGALHAGGILMQASTSTPLTITTVIQSLVVLFVAAPPLIRAMFRLHRATARGAGQNLARGWNG